LAIAGERTAGSAAERWLQRAAAELHRLLACVPAADGGDSPRSTLACLSLQRALERTLCHAERLTDARICLAGPPLPEATQRILHDLEQRLATGLQVLQDSLQAATAPDHEQTAEREISINALERELRERVSSGYVSRTDLHAVAVVDALECVGNHLYRLAETLPATELRHELTAVAVAI
jgi:hypothetical protein